jgi:hypothetical protein
MAEASYDLNISGGVFRSIEGVKNFCRVSRVEH